MHSLLICGEHLGGITQHPVGFFFRIQFESAAVALSAVEPSQKLVLILRLISTLVLFPVWKKRCSTRVWDEAREKVSPVVMTWSHLKAPGAVNALRWCKIMCGISVCQGLRLGVVFFYMGGGVDGNSLTGCSEVVIATSNTSLLIHQPASAIRQTHAQRSRGKTQTLSTERHDRRFVRTDSILGDLVLQL